MTNKSNWVLFIGMKYLSSIVLMLVALSSQAVEAEPNATFLPQHANALRSLSAEVWARPRSGANVAAMPAVRESVQALLEAPDNSTLVIRYPGGEEGNLWAEELQVWLISLGIDADKMDLRPGSSEPDQIELYIE